LGARFVEASKDRFVAERTIRDDLLTVGGRLHGGTLMSLADPVEAARTFLNLFAGARGALIRAEGTQTPRQEYSGLADAHHRRSGSVPLPHHPDADGAAWQFELKGKALRRELSLTFEPRRCPPFELKGEALRRELNESRR
jgi:hypothetical protein